MKTVAQVASGPADQRCRYTVLLARPVPQLAAIVEKIAEVTGVAVEDSRLVLEYTSGREPAAALLAELMRLGLPVASFSANAASLEEAYLRTAVRQVD